MKKIVVALLAVILAAPAFAAYYNAAQIKKLQDKLAAETVTWKKADIESRIVVFGLENPTWDVIVSSCVSVYAKYQIPAKRARGRACQFACFQFSQFAADAYKVATADSSIWIWHLVLHQQAKLGLSDQATFDLLADVILTRKETAADKIKLILTRMLAIAPNCDPAKVKTTLQKINRLLSPRLIKDKAKWEAPVAMVRTALETY